MRFPPHPEGSTADMAIKGSRRRTPRLPLTTPAQITAAERKALNTSTGRRGSDDTKTSKSVTARLVSAGWIRHHEGRLYLTESGRVAMNAVVPERSRGGIYQDVLLKVGHGYTMNRSRAVDDGGVVLDPSVLDPRHDREAAERLMGAKDRKDTARGLRDMARDPVTLQEDIAAMKQRQADEREAA
ncbi:MAG: hypothetical protein M3Q39_06285 [Actinomycetota bacterium]|nr:hypothetical protein [Actinomycetota bacterium]